MIIYFCDRDLNILGNASTQLPDGFRISQDQTVEEIDTGVNTFSCVISYTQDDRADLEPMVAEGNYILKQSARGDDDNAYDSVYQIIEVECDTESQEYSIYAEDAGLDLLNTLCPAVTLTGTIGQMMQYFLPSNWTLNLMDVPTTTQTNTWDGESTCTERLLSVANLWGCELYYSFVIDRLQIVERVVNVIEKRGNQEAIPQLRLNYDLKKIYWKKSIAELVTAVEVTGGTPEGVDVPIDLKGYNYSYTDPSTGEVYRVDTATGQMRNETAMGRWSSAIDPDGLWVGSFSFDTTDKAILAGQARAYLQRHSQVEVNYEVDFEKLPEDIQIGDRVNIIDEDGELYLEARLLRIETCEAEDTQTATIGEYLLRSGGISARVAQLASDLANARATDKVIQSQMQIITNTVDNTFILQVDSDVVLGIAHLSARLLKGNKDVKTEYDPNWFKWILRSQNAEKLLGRGYTLDVDMSVMSYASTVLCSFIRPQLYDLTDHNNEAITDANLDPIQVSFAGIYNQPVVTRNLLKSRLKSLNATPTVEVGEPKLSQEVNLYDRDGLNKLLDSSKTVAQYFWVENAGTEAGAHVTEIPKEEFIADPDNGGANLLVKSGGVTIRDGTTKRATFGETVVIGNDEWNDDTRGTTHATLDADGLKVIWKSDFVPITYFTIAEFGHATGFVNEMIDGNVRVTDAWSKTLAYEPSTGTTISLIISFGSAGRSHIDFVAGRASSIPITNALFTVTIEYDGNRTFSSDGTDLPVVVKQWVESIEYYASVWDGGFASIGSRDPAFVSNSDTATFGTMLVAEEQNQVATGCYNLTRDSNGESANYAFMVGNGSSANRSNALAVDWDGNLDIAGTITQSSDRRLKDHIDYLDGDADEFVRSLKPAHYLKDNKHHVGFYAQDVDEADKWGCMTGEMNGYMTLGYTELIAPLVAYCQHLEKRIEELEKGSE